MKRYLFDTSALLAHFRKEPGWEAVQALFERADAEIIITSITLTEFGRRLRDLGADDEAILSSLTNYQLLFGEIVAIDSTIALDALAIGRATPKRLPLVDALIAAAARSRSAILTHRDEHLRAIPAKWIHTLDLSAAD